MTHMTTDTDRHCTDLTQLSSREQLSALMDGALPEDQTRFLLRRLQHDADLAGNWERWRIASDVMRGLAPARRLPADFAERVSARLHGEIGAGAVAQAAATGRPAWLRWGGGAAMAAALAVVALMARPQLEDVAPQTAAAPAVQVAASNPPASPRAPAPQPPAPLADAPVVLAAAVAATAQPVRRVAARTARPVDAPAPAPELVAAQETTPAVELRVDPPASEIATRPWPRSILSQYGAGNSLAVGFGERLSRAAENPFAPPVFDAPPKLLSDSSPPSANAEPQPAQAGRDAPVETRTQH